MKLFEFYGLQESIDYFAQSIKEKLGLKEFRLHERGNDIFLNMIIVDQEKQGSGAGTQAMKLLTDYADKNQKRIILTPGLQDSSHGTTSRSRLVKFYKRFGFKESKGRNIDYAIGGGKMYRDPQI